MANTKLLNKKSFRTIENGCNGNKGLKCYVELYVMPSSLSNLKVTSKASQAVKK
jgi:hypothetical protein